VALIAGTVVGAVAVTVAKSFGHTDAEEAPEDAVDLEHSHTPTHVPARATTA
jgi:PTS system fructose-specific IIC component